MEQNSRYLHVGKPMRQQRTAAAKNVKFWPNNFDFHVILEPQFFVNSAHQHFTWRYHYSLDLPSKNLFSRYQLFFVSLIRAKEIFPLKFTKSMRPEPCWHKQLEERAQNWEKPFLPSGNPWLWINHHYWASYWAIDISQNWAYAHHSGPLSKIPSEMEVAPR